MASCWFSDKEIICYIPNLQNLWSSALIMQHRLLNNILKRRTNRREVLKLLLKKRKSVKEINEDIVFALDVQSNGDFDLSKMNW